MARTRPLPSLIAGLSSEEYDAPRPNPAELQAREAVSDRVAQAGCSSAADLANRVSRLFERNTEEEARTDAKVASIYMGVERDIMRFWERRFSLLPQPAST